MGQLEKRVSDVERALDRTGGRLDVKTATDAELCRYLARTEPAVLRATMTAERFAELFEMIRQYVPGYGEGYAAH